MDFVTWLKDEMDNRGMTKAELARRGRIDPSYVTRVLKEEQKAGNTFCDAVARAFNVPVEAVYRQAGLLPQGSKHDQLAEEAQHYFNQIETEEGREAALAMLKAIAERKKEIKKNLGRGRNRLEVGT